MQPRVSEAARIFLVAAFLALVASGPTLSGRASQSAAGATVMDTSGSVCTTCSGGGSGGSSNNNAAADKKVTIEKDGTAKVEEKKDSPCSSDKKDTPAWKQNGCDKKDGTQGETGKTEVTTGDGKTDLSCKPGEKCGVVSSGSGEAGSVSNPDAVAQYASGDGRPAISQVPIAADQATSAAMDRAFPGVSDGSAKLAYPISQPNTSANTSTGGSGSTPAPQSDVPGTTLDYSKPLQLNQNTARDIAALAPSQQGGGNTGGPGAQTAYGLATGFNPSYSQSPAAGFRGVLTPEGGYPGTIPSEAIFSAYASTPVVEPIPDSAPRGLSVAVPSADGVITGAELMKQGYLGAGVDPNQTYGFTTVPINTEFVGKDGKPLSAADIVSNGAGKLTAAELLSRIDPGVESTMQYVDSNGQEQSITAPMKDILAKFEQGGVSDSADSQIVNKISPRSEILVDVAGLSNEQLADQARSSLDHDGSVNVVKVGDTAIAYERQDPLTPDRVYTVNPATSFVDKGEQVATAMQRDGAPSLIANDAGTFVNAMIEDRASQQSVWDKAREVVLGGQTIESAWVGKPREYQAVEIAAESPKTDVPSSLDSGVTNGPTQNQPATQDAVRPDSQAENKNLAVLTTTGPSSWSVPEPGTGNASKPEPTPAYQEKPAQGDPIPAKESAADAPSASPPDDRTAFQKFFGIYPQAPTPQSQLDTYAQANQNPQYAEVPQSTGGILSGLLGISPAVAQPANNQVLQKVVATFQGIASCYDPTNKTSCGGTKYEGGMQIAGQGGVYLPNIPAAALKLPLALQTGCGVSGKNCQAIVTNTDTGKSVQVTINDNGPLTPGRVIDLNPVARTQLGGGDLSRVRVDILSALGTSAGAPSQSTASFSVTIPTSLPGTRQDASAANAKVSSRGVSLCVGTTGCAIDANSYVNSLCQPDTGCTAKQLGSQPDKNYNERSMSDAAERAADYKRQIEKVGANISGSRPVLFDNCQYSGTCGELIAAAAAWNAAHPNAQIQPMINNPVLVAEKLGRDATVNLLNSAAAAGGGGVWEPGGGSVAENAALRGASKFPSMPLLAVGTAAQMQTVGRIINTLGFQNIGTSVSSQTEGGSGYRDGVSGAELTLPPTGFVQQGLAKYADELAKQGLTPGLPSTDGGAKLLTPKEYAQLSAEDKSRAELYKQIPLQQGVMNADQLKGSFVQNGARYSSMGTVEQARTQIENGAKEAVAREFFRQDFTQDPRFKALQAQGKIPVGGGVRTFTAERVVSDAPAPVAAPSRLFNADKYPGINPVIARSMDAASRLLPPGYTVEVISASRAQGQSDVGARSLHIQRDQNGNSKAVDVTIRDAQGKKLCNFQCPQTFKTYQQFMQNVKAYQDQLFPDLANLGRWGGYFVSGNWNDLMHYDLGPKSDPRAGSWEQGLYQAYARYGLPGDVGGGMGPIGAFPIPPAGTAGQEPQYVIKDGDAVVGTMSLPPGALGPDGQVVLAVGSDGVPILDKNGRSVFAAIMPDVGKVEAKVNVTEDAFSISLEHTPPTPPQTDARTTLERVRDAAGQALADANQRVRDAFGQIGSQQPGPGAVPANNSRPAGGAPAPSSSGAMAPVQQQRPVSSQLGQQQPSTTAVPTQPDAANQTGVTGQTGATSGTTPVLSVSGGATATGSSGETFSCTPGTVVNGSSATPITIAWKCPAGTTSTGAGFSTLGTNAGTITTVVSTTSSLVTYRLSCGTAMQTLSCSVKVLHPKVILVAKPAEVAAGERVSFSWSGTDVDTCALYAPPSVVVARGGASGGATSLPFTRSAVFRMQCAAGSATTTTAVTVRVKGDSQQPLDTTLP